MTTHVPQQQLNTAANILRAGGLVAFPTETVYGLGADACNSAAVRRIYLAKGRPPSNPLIIHVASADEIPLYADLTRAFDRAVVEQRIRTLSVFWPGPLSVVLPASERIAKEALAGGDTVAIRIPKHPVALALLAAFKGPIAGPSANPSNYVSPTTADHVREGLGESVDCILDGGPCSIGIESTVLSLVDSVPRILRPGAVTREQLKHALGCEVIPFSPDACDSAIPLPSPGLLAQHYAPRTRVVLRTALSSIQPLPKRVGVILFAPATLPFEPAYTTVLSSSGNLNDVAAKLFAALREHDHRDLDLIVVDTCEPVGLGEAIMDRLLRASATSI